MALPNPYVSYKNAEVKTASPAQLVVLLYEGALKHISLGESQIARPEGFTQASINLFRAMNIVSELLGMLNPTASPELASRLSEIYRYVLQLIHRSLQLRDPEPLAEARKHMSSLADAWREVAQTAA